MEDKIKQYGALVILYTMAVLFALKVANIIDIHLLMIFAPLVVPMLLAGVFLLPNLIIKSKCLHRIGYLIHLPSRGVIKIIDDWFNQWDG